MQRILVIADDFSGAAEIAGIGLRHGLPTRLVRDRLDRAGPGLTVVDSDTRLLSAEAAARTVRECIAAVDPAQFDLIYKKTDSVLRGPIRAELESLMAVFNRSGAVLVPQNPSRGRTIIGGEYFIDGKRLDATSFAHDPDHPARTASVIDLLGSADHPRPSYADPGGSPAATGITVGGGRCADDLAHWAARAGPQLLPAGGADFFTAILEHHGLTRSRPLLTRLDVGPALFVCGSASAYSRELLADASHRRMATCGMPDAIFHARSIEPVAVREWGSQVLAAAARSQRVLIAIAQQIDPAPGAGRRLQDALAQLVAEVLGRTSIASLLLEGGATASAVCRRMGWRDFNIIGEYAVGIVRMSIQHDGPAPAIIVKPGSYPWPDAVWM